MGAKLSAATIETPAGGGTFALESVTLGVFLVDQPAHQIALGSDRRKTTPLRAREGRVLPKGAVGFCAYDASHRFVTVSIPDRLWVEAGGAYTVRLCTADRRAGPASCRACVEGEVA